MSIAYNSLVYPPPENFEKPRSVEDGKSDSTRKILYERDNRHHMHFPSLVCIMSIGFIANCEYGVVMPSIWGYLQSIGGTESQLGFALSAASLAQLCFLPLFGFWSDRRTMREVITVAMFIGICGNVLYSLAGLPAFGSYGPYAVIAGRALTGIYMGVISVTNSYVALVTTPEKRTKFMAQINGINALGMVSGPGFNLFLTRMNFKVGPVVVDAGTSPGWFIAILVLLSCCMFFIVFKEPKAPPAKRQELIASVDYKTINHNEPPKMTGRQYMWFILTAFLKPYGACFVICFVQNFDFSVLETIATPMTAELYGFGAFRNSLFYSALSLEMVVIIFITATASRFGVQDRFILLAAQTSVGVGSVGMLFYYTKDSVQFVIFCLFAAFLVAGIPSQNISVMSTYSKLLTAEFGQTKQGLYTGIIMLFGSLARILGPLWGGFTLEHEKKVLLFSLLVGMWAFDVMFTLSFFSKLKPTTTNESGEKVSLLANGH